MGRKKKDRKSNRSVPSLNNNNTESPKPDPKVSETSTLSQLQFSCTIPDSLTAMLPKSTPSQQLDKEDPDKSMSVLALALANLPPLSSCTLSYHSKQPTGLQSIPELPDLPIIGIISNLPLPELIHNVPLVNKQWVTLKQSALAKKRTLVLYIGPNVVEDLILKDIFHIPYKSQLTDANGKQLFPTADNSLNRLKLALLTKQTADKLIELLPTITTLELKINLVPVESTLTQVIRLLKHWAPALKSFAISCRFNKERSMFSPKVDQIRVSVNLMLLINAVNELPVLERLKLDLREELLLAVPLELPILARLKEFYFLASPSPSLHYLAYSLLVYAEPNEKLTAIGIGCMSIWDQYLKYYATTRLRDKFVHLRNAYYSHEYTLTPPHDSEERRKHDATQKQFITVFSQQHNYATTLYTKKMNLLPPLLAPLTNLVHLYLRTNSGVVDDSRQDTLQPLPSVKVLTLIILTVTLDNLTNDHWSELLPNLQFLVLYHQNVPCEHGTSKTGFICCENHYLAQMRASDREDEPDEYSAKGFPTRRQLRRLLRSFKDCKQLKKLKYFKRGDGAKFIELTREELFRK